MKISRAEFEKSAVHFKDYPRGSFPEVAFAGRSNVGKSSMMNTLLGRKGLVKTSGTPGKTRTLNFFRIQSGKSEFRFVDLPGYGYAKVPHQVRVSWKNMIDTYLEQRRELRGVVVIMDIRRGVMEMDLGLLNWLTSKRIDTLVVLTKADKLSKSKQAIAAAQVRKDLLLRVDEPILFSSDKGSGKGVLWQRLNLWIRSEGSISKGSADSAKSRQISNT